MNENIKIITANLKVSREKLRSYEYWGGSALREIKRDFANKIAEQIADNFTIEAEEFPDHIEYYARVSVRDLLKKEENE